MDQIIAGPLPRDLTGRGEVEISLAVDGKAPNGISVVFK